MATPAARPLGAQPGATRPARSTPPDAWLKPGIFVGSLVPLAYLVWRAATNRLGANPIAEIENELGLAGLILLVASLACSPARRAFGWTWAPRVRRELGLLAFFYASLHVAVYIFIDQALNVSAMTADVLKRPFITVGFAAMVLLIPLALTSTKQSIRRMGFKRWQRLHYLAYVAAILVVIHFFWRVKIDVSQPLIYAYVLASLFVIRAGVWLLQKRRPARPVAGAG
ncbi:MAG: sulfoxide reductase heme-binding subunit YedZ [Chloroflexi bacterium]|nr:sulfoxide reductase heme-binding subunit YedZ [Chloroflexota bacterium]